MASELPQVRGAALPGGSGQGWEKRRPPRRRRRRLQRWAPHWGRSPARPPLSLGRGGGEFRLRRSRRQPRCWWRGCCSSTCCCLSVVRPSGSGFGEARGWRWSRGSPSWGWWLTYAGWAGAATAAAKIVPPLALFRGCFGRRLRFKVLAEDQVRSQLGTVVPAPLLPLPFCSRWMRGGFAAASWSVQPPACLFSPWRRCLLRLSPPETAHDF